MRLQVFRHLWGVSDSWEQSFPRFQSRGYAGIEAVLPRAAEAGRFRRLLGRHGFQFIAQIVTRGATVREHITSFRQQVRAASTWQPVVINTHSGSDTWSDSEASAYFSEVLRVERDIRCPVAHETHRSRLLFHPLQTRRLVEEFPDLKLCCDFSHWVCVCERLLEDQRRVIALCAERAWHVHARVGYPQGPQVSDPRAPEYAGALAAHEDWWRLIWRAQRERGMDTSTLTPEFGPPDYLHTLPFTRQAVANLEDVCDWQAQRQTMNFGHATASRIRRKRPV